MPKESDNLINDIISELQELDVFDDGIDPKIEKQLFKDLAGIDGFHDYLSQALAKDIKTYFQASPGAQLMIKGAFNRTLYLKKKLKEVGITATKKQNIRSKRHL